jgi:hypothetical protein
VGRFRLGQKYFPSLNFERPKKKKKKKKKKKIKFFFLYFGVKEEDDVCDFMHNLTKT